MEETVSVAVGVRISDVSSEEIKTVNHNYVYIILLLRVSAFVESHQAV
jgi:hypothetical protein